MRKEFHQFQLDGKKAIVYFHTEMGWEVDLYENDVFLETRKVHDHSESYAEDVAENFVQGIYSV